MFRVNFALLALILITAIQVGPMAQSTVKQVKRQTASVSGQVTLNGEPLGGVTVQLFPDRMSVSQDNKSPLQAVTDEHGNYRVTDIVAGAYQINIIPNEYMITGGVQSNIQTKMVSVAEGEKVEGFDLALKRGGVITGRVTDAGGRPLSRQTIQLTRIGDDGKPQPAPFNHPAMKITDEQGVYRIIRVPDGRYLVSAGIAQTQMFVVQNRGDVYYPQTFHPNVSDQSKATAVEVTEGVELTGVDILMEEARKAFDIKGRVVRAETGEAAEDIEIFYMRQAKGGGMAGPRSQGARSNSEGEFLFQGVLPGKYAIYPQIGGNKEYFSEPVICEITDARIDGVEVKLQQGGSISGVVVIEGSNDPAVKAKLAQVSIWGVSKSSQPFPAPREGVRINADGGFRIAGLRPGRFHFSLGGDPSSRSFLIKRIERDGVPTRDGVEIGPGEKLSNVRVIVAHGNLALHGDVKVVGGALPTHIGIYLNLRRVNESESNPSLGAHVDARGQFIFQNLVPGEYEARLICVNYQSGEPTDRSISKLISNIRQKVFIGPSSQPTITIVIDLGQKESNK